MKDLERRLSVPATWVTVSIIAVVLAVSLVNSAFAAENPCQSFSYDLTKELMRRGYTTGQQSCHAEDKGDKFKFTIVIDGKKEVVWCDEAECK